MNREFKHLYFLEKQFVKILETHNLVLLRKGEKHYFKAKFIGTSSISLTYIYIYIYIYKEIYFINGGFFSSSGGKNKKKFQGC